MNSTRTRSLFALMLFAACGAPPAEDQPIPPVVQPPSLDPPKDVVGPSPRGQVPRLEGFDVESIADASASPVVAVTPDGQKHVAIIEQLTGAPAIGRSGDAMYPLPGSKRAADSLRLVASADGMLHAVWLEGSDLVYGRIDPRGYRLERVEISVALGVFGPTIAIGPEGEAVVAYGRREQFRNREIGSSIAVLEFIEGVATEPTTINEGCCTDAEGFPTRVMSAPSIAIGPDGDVHVAFSAGSFERRTIEYVVGRGTEWTSRLTIPDAAEAHPPVVVADERGAHITYLLEGNHDVWYVRVDRGVATTPESLYTSDAFINMALIIRDGAGVMHLLVDERRRTEGAIVYVRGDRLDEAPIDAVISMRFPSPTFTAAAGGAAISAGGELYFATRWDDGRADVVFGRPARQD